MTSRSRRKLQSLISQRESAQCEGGVSSHVIESFNGVFYRSERIAKFRYFRAFVLRGAAQEFTHRKRQKRNVVVKLSKKSVHITFLILPFLLLLHRNRTEPN